MLQSFSRFNNLESKIHIKKRISVSELNIILSKRQHSNFHLVNGNKTVLKKSTIRVNNAFPKLTSRFNHTLSTSRVNRALPTIHRNPNNLISCYRPRSFSTSNSRGKKNDATELINKIKAQYFNNNQEEFDKFFRFSGFFVVYSILVLSTMVLTTNKDRRKLYSYIFGSRSNLDQIDQSLGSNVRLVVHENKGVTVGPSSGGLNTISNSSDAGTSFVSNSNSDYSHYADGQQDGSASNSQQGNNFRVDSSSNNRARFLTFMHTSYVEKLIDFLLQSKGLKYEDVEIIYDKIRSDSQLYSYLLLPIILVVFPFLMYKNMSGMSNPINKMMNDQFGMKQIVSKPDTKFTQVLGCEEAKMEIHEFVNYLKNREKFEKLKARIPQGAILYGPPGTGKTLLAKALAGECGVNFFSCSGSEFIQMFVGRGASRVRDLFKTARMLRPSIIFIDEIDAIASNRDLNQVSFSEKEGTLNQLLSEMDGFQNNKDVIVIGGTNKFASLDKAILRPGRFDRHIFVGPPDINGRKDLFKLYMKPLKIDVNVDKLAADMAQMTPTFTGASIANICNEAAIFAARVDSTHVEKSHFLQAIDRVTVGNKSSRKLSAADKKTVAIHEAGHAVIGWFMSTVKPLIKTTIVPRGDALGFAQYLPSEDHFYSKDQIFEQMVLLFGGRAAESVIIGEITTSASDDLSRITKLAYQYVGVWGMDEKIGQLSFLSYSDHNRDFFGENKEFQTNLGNQVDEQVLKLVESAYEQAKKIITENKDKLIKISELLNKQETVEKAQIESILGEKTFHTPHNPFLQPTPQ